VPSVKKNACLYCINCTKFGQLILRKILKYIATRYQILRLKCTKFDIGWGSAPDPAEGAFSAPHTPSLDLRISRQGGGRERDGKGGDGNGREDEGRGGRERNGGRKGKGKMGGTEQGMAWGRERERRKGREREERGYSPQTLIPGAATGFLLELGTGVKGPKTRMTELTNQERILTISETVWIQYINMTDIGRQQKNVFTLVSVVS